MFKLSMKSLSLALVLCTLAITIFPGTASAKYRPFKCPTENADAEVPIALDGDGTSGYTISGLIDVRMPREEANVECVFLSWNDARRTAYNTSLISLAKKLLWENSDSVYSHETIYGDKEGNGGMDEAALRAVLIASPTRAEWLGSARWHTPHTRGNVPAKFGGSKAKAKAKATAPAAKPEPKAKAPEAPAPKPEPEAQPCPAPLPEAATPATK